MRDLENVLLVAGYNLWSTKPAELITFAKYCKENCEGNVPDDPSVLMARWGIGRKICMLIMQDCFDKKLGIVVDSHVMDAVLNLKWTVANNESKIAEELESWVPPDLYKSFNETIGGLRQLWNKRNHRARMEEVARELSIWSEFQELVRKRPKSESSRKSFRKRKRSGD